MCFSRSYTQKKQQIWRDLLFFCSGMKIISVSITPVIPFLIVVRSYIFSAIRAVPFIDWVHKFSTMWTNTSINGLFIFLIPFSRFYPHPAHRLRCTFSNTPDSPVRSYTSRTYASRNTPARISQAVFRSVYFIPYTLLWYLADSGSLFSCHGHISPRQPLCRIPPPIPFRHPRVLRSTP